MGPISTQQPAECVCWRSVREESIRQRAVELGDAVKGRTGRSSYSARKSYSFRMIYVLVAKVDGENMVVRRVRDQIHR